MLFLGAYLCCRHGAEIEDVEELAPEDVIYISKGEDFVPPDSLTNPCPAIFASPPSASLATVPLPLSPSEPIASTSVKDSATSVNNNNSQEQWKVALKHHFGFSSFRPLQVGQHALNLPQNSILDPFNLQMEVIEACMKGRDIFVCMATGTESICIR